MPDDGPTSERLESLRARWASELESDRPSGVFLQLADEYRRLGRTGDAVAVLEEGLGRNPNHPAALVALGRCRLELGEAAESTAVLERVIAADPTQMVAYRLLVEGYVERGMAEEARQRLRVYSLLNDADPEIAELRRRIGEIERRHRDEPESPYLEDPEDLEDEPEAREEEPAAAPEAAPPPPAPSPAAPTPAPLSSVPPSQARAPAGEGGGEPFPHLADPSSRGRYLASLESGGLFEVGRDGTEAPEPASDDLFGLGSGPHVPAPDLSSLLDGTRGGTRDATGTGPQASEPAEAPEPAAPLPAPDDDRASRRTVTLGRLYLRQGHREEAMAIFREVLERDLENAEARAELEALETPAAAAAPEPEPAGGPAALTAADLLAGWDGGAGRSGAEGTTARKRHVLERYLERIRGRSGRDVH